MHTCDRAGTAALELQSLCLGVGGRGGGEGVSPLTWTVTWLEASYHFC